jgi:hypothetical protein
MTLMPNPWLDLDRNLAGGSYILEIDRDFIKRNNDRYASSPEKKDHGHINSGAIHWVS